MRFDVTGAGKCTTTVSNKAHWAVLPHLSGFYFVSAGDVERRVLPALETLVRAGRQRATCATAELLSELNGGDPVIKQEACCAEFGTANDHLCFIAQGDPANPSPSAGKRIDSLALFCENLAGKASGEEYVECNKPPEYSGWFPPP